MIKRSAPTVNTDTPVGPDVDLELEDVRLVDGSRLTREVAESIVEKARRAGGRPSLCGATVHSPQLASRVPAEVRERAARVADREGKNVSQLARELLECHLGARPHCRRS
ncbi:MAG: ribbon-helix-helix protein, CopG family [Acidimicrobiales bacterium]